MTGTWEDHANCRGADPDVFFPKPPKTRYGSPFYERAVRQAKQICETCPSLLPCYKTAVDNEEQHGVWGGVDFYGKNTRAALGPAQCGTDRGYRSHRARGEDACPACRQAHVQRNQTNKQQRQQGTR